MSYYEHFQESELNSAYNSQSLNDTLHEVPFCDEEVDNDPKPTTQTSNAENSTIQNLWEFLGLSNLDKKQKECVFDCSIYSSQCLENCEDKTNKKKCNYKCLKHGLYCAKKCIIPKEPIRTTQSLASTQSLETTQVVNQTNFMPPKANRYYSGNYAPFDSNLWPQYNNPGWKVNNDSSSDDYIEVLVRDYIPVEEGSTDVSMLF